MAGTRTSRAISRNEQKENTRAAVLEAAIEAFSKKGFEGTSTTEIAKASGAPVPLIMYHFQSKEGLWRAAVDEIFARVDTFMDKGMAAISAADGEEAIRAAVKVQISAIAAYPEYMRLILQEGAQKSDRLNWLVETHQRRMSDKYIEQIKAAQVLGFIPDMDPMHLKYILSGAFSFAIALAPEYEIITGRQVLNDQFIDQHIDACFSLLFRKPNASG